MKLRNLFVSLLLVVALLAGAAFAEALPNDAPADVVEAPAGIVETTEAPAEITEEPIEEAEEEEEEPTGLAWAVEKLFNQKWYIYVIIVLLVVMAAAIFVTSRRAKWSPRVLAAAAMCIAIAFVLSMLRIARMPQGGSITPASMLPLILFSLAYGPGYGLIAGCAFGFLSLISDPYIIHVAQMLVDYPLAYAAVALCCAAVKIKNRRVKMVLAVLLGYLGRLIMATISGGVFFAEYAGEQNAWVYSVLYNLSYLGWEALLTAVIVLIPGMDRITDSLKKA